MEWVIEGKKLKGISLECVISVRLEQTNLLILTSNMPVVCTRLYNKSSALQNLSMNL